MRSNPTLLIAACALLVVLSLSTTAEALTVTGISPAEGAGGTTGTYYVYGTNFATGAEVAIDDTDSGHGWVYAQNEVTETSGRIRCTLAIPAGTAIGYYDVDVRNPGDPSWTWKVNTFIVLPDLAITSISPASAHAGHRFTADLYGTGFASQGAYFILSDGNVRFDPSSVTYGTSEHLWGTFTLPLDAPLGAYYVYVRNNVTGNWVVKPNAFTILPPTPTITGISPAEGAGGTTGTYYVYGTNFATGADVVILYGCIPIDAENEVTETPGRIRCTLDIPPGTPPENYDVTIKNPGDLSWTRQPDLFQVLPDLTISSISPASAHAGSTFTADLYGSGFASQGAYFMLYSAFGDHRYDPSSVTYIDHGHLRGTFDLPAGAVPGSYHVYVRNNVSGNWVVKYEAFVIQEAWPTITSIAPTSAMAGTSARYTITGTNFRAGAAVSIQGGDIYTGTIDATDVTVVNANTITCTLAIPANAGPGGYIVYVCYDGVCTDSTTYLLFVARPPPTVTSISPNNGVQGTTVAVTNLSGTGFASPATVKLTRSGSTDIPATSVVVVSPTTITCSFAIPASAASGQWNVVVTSGGQSATLPNGFTVSMLESRTPVAVITARPNPAIVGSVVTLDGRMSYHEDPAKEIDSWEWDLNDDGIYDVSGLEITTSFGSSGDHPVTLRVTDDGIPEQSDTTKLTVRVYDHGIDDLHAVSVSANVLLSWTGTAADRYAVYRSTVPGGPYLLIGSTAETSYEDTNVVVGTTYYYEVHEVTASGDEYSSSNEASVRVTEPTPVLNGFSPATAPRGTTIAARVAGTGFLATAEVAIADPVSAMLIYATGETVSGGGTRIDCSLILPGSMGTGASTVYVRNSPTGPWASRPGALTVTAGPAVATVPGGVGVPQDLNGDGKYEDVNGNGRRDFADVVLYFNQMTWIAANEPLAAFDYNGNSRIDFADIAWLFNRL